MLKHSSSAWAHYQEKTWQQPWKIWNRSALFIVKGQHKKKLSREILKELNEKSFNKKDE